MLVAILYAQTDVLIQQSPRQVCGKITGVMVLHVTHGAHLG